MQTRHRLKSGSRPVNWRWISNECELGATRHGHDRGSQRGQSESGIRGVYPSNRSVWLRSLPAQRENTLTWDETNLITAVAIVNSSPTAATVTVTLWDENGNTIGTSSISLPPNGKTEAELRTLPGLSGMVGQRGGAQFTVSAGNVAVLGLRADGPALTSIPTTNLQ